MLRVLNFFRIFVILSVGFLIGVTMMTSNSVETLNYITISGSKGCAAMTVGNTCGRNHNQLVSEI